MANQELKSVTIRVPSNLLDLIEARVSDRNTRTDVIIDLLKQALDQPVAIPDLGISVVEQKLSEVNQRVDDLVKSLSSVRQQITLLDSKAEIENLSKMVKQFETRLLAVEKNKAIFNKSQNHDQLPLIRPVEVTDVKINLPIEQIEEKPLEVVELITKQVLQPHNRASLSKRFGIDPSTIGKRKASGKFTKEWSKSQDPDQVAWEYREDTKKYYPLNV